MTGLPEEALGAMVGRQTPILAVFVPFVLVGLVDGARGLRETWPVALVAGLVFGVAQYVTSNFISLALTDIVAALLAAGAVVLLVRIRPPRRAEIPADAPQDTRETVSVSPAARRGRRRDGGGTGPGSPEGSDHDDHSRDTRRDVVLAYAPYLIIILLFSIQQIPFVDDALGATTTKFNWPGLNVVTEAGKPVSTPGVHAELAGVRGHDPAHRRDRSPRWSCACGRRRPLAAYGRTLVQLRTAIVTVMAVLALAYVMNTSGQTLTLGGLLAGTGGFFAVLSPVLGWLGVAVTGSDTSANSLFGALQVTAAEGAGLDPILLAAANSSGGVLGKMISPQNLAIAASAVAMSGREGEILRKVLLWSLVFLAGMCVLVYLQSTPVLGWMVVSG